MRFFCAVAGWLGLAVLVGGTPVRAEPTPAEPVRASLIASADAIVPGQPLRVALVLRMAPGWHTYWQYAGDAGLPTKIRWTLPDGFGVGPIEWPLPEAKLEPGDLQVYSYGGEVALLQTIQVPAGLTAGEVTLRANVTWLMCADICVPGKAGLTLTLPVRAQAGRANADVFAAAEARLPQDGPPPFAVSWRREGKNWVGDVAAPAGSQLEFFPLPAEGQIVEHVQVSGSRITVPTTGPLTGVLAVNEDGTRRGWLVQATGSAPAPAAAAQSAPLVPAWWGALWAGLLGGLILNLMPCVLPVISLKIFGFVRQAGQSRRAIAWHGLAFAGGVYAWFLGLGLAIVGLRAAGFEPTWASQFQNPFFNLAVAALVLAFALNLFGVFEVALPGRATTALGEAGAQDGLGASFFQGAFATLLATPCTGPFLGSSLAFAFSQPAPVTLLMFGSMATGMALPYLALSLRPDWVRLLPRPGPWMERLKQFMGFPLLAALLWLLSIIGGQRGVAGVVWAGAFLLCVALALWVFGAVSAPTVSRRARALGLAAAAVVAGGGGWLFVGQLFAREKPAAATVAAPLDGIAWRPYSKAAVDAWLAEGRAVFIDFTADWCLTCKFNERVAINVPAVRTKIAELGIIPVKADWTNANPEITAALKALDRVGVPVCVVYPAGRPNEPIVLPEILTEGIVLDALERAR